MRAGRVWVALAVLSRALQVALAQSGRFFPGVDPTKLQETLIAWAVWATWGAAIVMLVYAMVKVVYGIFLAGSGIPAVSSRGYGEVFEGVKWPLIFGIALLVAPLVVYLLADAGMLPGWIADAMSEAFEAVWRGPGAGG